MYSLRQKGDGCRRLLPLLALPLLVAPGLAGCLGGSASPSASGAAAHTQPRSWVNISVEDLEDRPGNLVVTLRIVKDTPYDQLFNNEAPLDARGFEGGTWSSCAAVQWGSGLGGPPALERTWSWAYTQGHAIRVASEHGSASLDHPAAVDSYFGLRDDTVHLNGTLEAGTWLRYSVAAEDAAGPSFHPWINVSAPKPAFEVVDRSEYAFTCAANTEPFGPTVVHHGLPPAPLTVAHEAAAHVSTTEGTEAYLYAAAYPYPPAGRAGICETAISLDNLTVNATGPERRCYIEAFGPPGRVGLHLDSVVGYGPVVAFWVYDRVL